MKLSIFRLAIRRRRAPGFALKITAAVLGIAPFAARAQKAPGTPDGTAGSHMAAAGSLRQQGRFDEALAEAQIALKLHIRESGETSEAVARTLNNIGMLWSEAGKAEEAGEAYGKAISTWERLGRRDCVTLNNMAILMETRQRIPEAAKYMAAALEAARTAVPRDEVAILEQAGAAARFFLENGEPAKAGTLYAEEQAGLIKAGASPLRVAMAGLHRSLALRRGGNREEGKAAIEAALREVRKAEGVTPGEMAQALDEAALIFTVTGDYGEARPLLETAVELLDGTAPPEDLKALAIRNRLGMNWVQLELTARAIPLLRKCLEISLRLRGPQHIETLNTAANLGQAMAQSGDASAAEALLREVAGRLESRARDEHLPAPGLMATVLNNLGLLYLSVHDFSRAIDHLRYAADLFETARPGDPRASGIRINLADVLTSRGRTAEALTELQKAQKQLANGSPFDLARLHNGMALLEMERKQPAAALGEFQLAAEYFGRVLPEGHPRLRTLACGRLAALKMTGKKAAAEALAESLESATAASPASADDPDFHFHLALHWHDAGDSVRARARALKWQESWQPRFQALLLYGGEEQRNRLLSADNPFQLFPALSMTDELAQSSLRIKGIVLDATRADRELLRSGEGDAGLQDRWRTLRRELTRLVLERDLTPESKLPLPDTERGRQIADAAGELERIEKTWLERGPGSHRKDELAKEWKLTDLRAALTDGAVFVDLLRYSRRDAGGEWTEAYGALVVPHDGPIKWVVLGDCARIDQIIAGFQAALRDTTADAMLLDRLAALRETLWNPVSAAMPSAKATPPEVFLCPDGQLHFVPFGALPAKDGGFSGTERRIRYVTSGRALITSAERISWQRTFVAVAAPDFESAVAPGASGSSPARRIDKVLWPPVPWSASTGTGQAVAGDGPLRTFAKSVSLTALPAAETEARTAARIAAAAGWQADLLLGAKASEPAVDALQNPGILHIGTHGIDLPGEIQQSGITMQVDPLSSQFLALTGSARTLRSWQEGTAPPPENDGILTGTEVAMMNLRSTLLVTAAACHTASGTANRSEGLFGLSRAFLQAGAKNVLSALWDIDDETTAQFMEAFYTELLRHKDPDPGAVFPVICAEWLTKIAKTKGTAAAVRTIGAFTLTGRR